MFFKAFITSALVAFLGALVVGVAVLPGVMTQQARTVEFTTSEPSASAPTAPMGALEAALAHADVHGLTDCVDPEHARLDDVVLTVPSDPGAEVVITEVGFDEALVSGELGRWNVLACAVVDRAP
ncbi:hypothetical protein O9K63_02830 [Janibacter cremeus]|uniref:hypothetical protein n=1 Tax=Janibacter cremeus TaxID=1285192 RepID=UPI0023F8333C|nr:hypothetical protein [Janibacter cremeus]WEV78746.1 hypothetical protein O9K63_02830 [Janibacter cremeus]